MHTKRDGRWRIRLVVGAFALSVLGLGVCATVPAVAGDGPATSVTQPAQESEIWDLPPDEGSSSDGQVTPSASTEPSGAPTSAGPDIGTEWG